MWGQKNIHNLLLLFTLCSQTSSIKFPVAVGSRPRN